MTQPNQPIIVPASKLSLSPHNVRKTQSAEADAQLRASIAERGVLQNLVGVPVPRKKGHFSITAGGRRLTQIQALIAEGTLPADYGVPVLPLSSAEDAVEASLTENFQRLQMNPADECLAFQHILSTENADVSAVARRFGVTVRFVEGRLRLSQLADVVFTALRDGEITLDVAMAFAASPDTARQERVYRARQAYYGGLDPAVIRRMMTEGAVRGTDARAVLVGREAYTEAGGRIEVDLFSDTSAESWLDVDLLSRLAAEKMEAAAAEVKAGQGFGTVVPQLEPSVQWSDTRDLTVVHGQIPELTPEQLARQEAIELELSEIEERSDDDGGFTEEDDERWEQLQSELQSLLQRTPILSDEQKSGAIAYLVLGTDGQPRLHHQVYTRPVAEQAPVTRAVITIGGAPGEGGLPTSEPAEAEPVLGQRLQEELSYQRSEILALHVASDPHFALDLGTLVMVDAEISKQSSYLASTLRASRPMSRVPDWKSDNPAAKAWDEMEGALDRSWTAHEKTADRYDGFCALSDEARAAWFGWAIARTIDASIPGKSGDAFLSHLGRKLQIDVAKWWRPTAANYFGRVPKSLILRAFGEVGGNELVSRYAASKKVELAAAAEKLFRGDAIVEPQTKAAALAWIPDNLGFGAAPADNALIGGSEDESVPAPRTTDEGGGAAEATDNAPAADGLEGSAPVDDTAAVEAEPDGAGEGYGPYTPDDYRYEEHADRVAAAA